jgi:uncharacterized protein
MFIGRTYELQQLQDKYNTNKSELAAIYGRRRIGKSCLVEKFAEDKEFFYKFEGIEGGNTREQMSTFVKTLNNYVHDPFLEKIAFDSWQGLFQYLTEKLIDDKKRTKKL